MLSLTFPELRWGPRFTMHRQLVLDLQYIFSVLPKGQEWVRLRVNVH